MGINYFDYIREKIAESIAVKISLFGRIETIDRIADCITRCYEMGNKLLIFGNGGSAADSQHIAGEFMGRFKEERKAFLAIALTTDTSVITALSNDYNFDMVFARQVEAYAKREDILLGISTSGNSENVIQAFRKGKEIGTYNVSLTGEGGGRLRELSDICFDVPSRDTPRIQEAHELVYHIIYDLVEKSLEENV